MIGCGGMRVTDEPAIQSYISVIIREIIILIVYTEHIM
jgi:hypothetical protein